MPDRMPLAFPGLCRWNYPFGSEDPIAPSSHVKFEGYATLTYARKGKGEKKKGEEKQWRGNGHFFTPEPGMSRLVNFTPFQNPLEI